MARKTSALIPKAERVQDARLLKHQEKARSAARYARRKSSGRTVAR